MFGDFEAQRHWMEITYHLPVQEWFVLRVFPRFLFQVDSGYLF